MRTDHNGLVYRCFMRKERFARISETTGCNHDGARMSIAATDYIDRLEKELQNANAKIVELQGQLIAQAHNRQDNYTYGIRG